MDFTLRNLGTHLSIITMDQCAVRCPKQLMQIYKSLLRVEASTALCLLCLKPDRIMWSHMRESRYVTKMFRENSQNYSDHKQTVE